jgi:hypothetical protein
MISQPRISYIDRQPSDRSAFRAASDGRMSPQHSLFFVQLLFDFV